MIILPQTLKFSLRNEPEYGMGYQVGRVRLNTGNYVDGIIINGSVFISKDEIDPISVLVESYQEIVKLAEKSHFSIENYSLSPRPLESMKNVRRIYKNGNLEYSKYPAKDSETINTISGDVFKRFSAFIEDFKITPGSGLFPNTFATTERDARNVTTGQEAIARYSIKNKMPANKVFTIKPPEHTEIKVGTTASDFGEPGGGVEVIFVNGSPDRTVTGPEFIPER